MVDDNHEVVKVGQGEDLQAGYRRGKRGWVEERLRTKQSIATGDGLGDRGHQKRRENRWDIENVVAAESS
jgi:hypothetical protein